MRNILFLIFIVPVSNYLYPAYCDDDDISKNFTDGIWKLDLSIQTRFVSSTETHDLIFIPFNSQDGNFSIIIPVPSKYIYI